MLLLGGACDLVYEYNGSHYHAIGVGDVEGHSREVHTPLPDQGFDIEE
jgi:hypothetical protein